MRITLDVSFTRTYIDFYTKKFQMYLENKKSSSKIFHRIIRDKFIFDMCVL